jgi:hypothetical protein
VLSIARGPAARRGPFNFRRRLEGQTVRGHPHSRCKLVAIWPGGWEGYLNEMGLPALLRLSNGSDIEAISLVRQIRARIGPPDCLQPKIARLLVNRLPERHGGRPPFRLDPDRAVVFERPAEARTRGIRQDRLIEGQSAFGRFDIRPFERVIGVGQVAKVILSFEPGEIKLRGVGQKYWSPAALTMNLGIVSRSRYE